jgi:predicted nuclease with TOPRIM domain
MDPSTLSVDEIIGLTATISGVLFKLIDYIVGRIQGKLDWTVKEREALAKEREELRVERGEQRAELQKEIDELTASQEALRRENRFLRTKMYDVVKVLRSCEKISAGGTCEKLINELELI